MPVSNASLQGVHKRKWRGDRADQFISSMERADLLCAYNSANTRIPMELGGDLSISARRIPRGYVKINRVTSFVTSEVNFLPGLHTIQIIFNSIQVNQCFIYKKKKKNHR